MPARRAVERRVLTEISQAIEDRDCAHRIIQRIVGSTFRIIRNNREQVRIAIDGINHIDAIGTGHGRPKISGRVEVALHDAMNCAAKAQRVPVAVGSAAVVPPEQIALNGLARTKNAGSGLERSQLQVKRSARHEKRVSAQRRVEGVDHLLISEAPAMRKTSAVPVQPEHSGWHIDLVAQFGQAVGGP